PAPPFGSDSRSAAGGIGKPSIAARPALPSSSGCGAVFFCRLQPAFSAAFQPHGGLRRRTHPGLAPASGDRRSNRALRITALPALAAPPRAGEPSRERTGAKSRGDEFRAPLGATRLMPPITLRSATR